MAKQTRTLAVCCLCVIAALYVVGNVSHLVIRHIVPTAPLWLPVWLGFRNSAFTKWAALPCLALWLLLMTFIWLFLLGWARIVSGTFSPTEIAMTLIVGAAAIVGLTIGARLKSGARPLAATGVLLLLVALQVSAIGLSLLPAIVHR